MARIQKKQLTINGTTGQSNLWTWKHVVTEYWEDDSTNPNYYKNNKSIVVIKSYLGRTSNSGSYFQGGCDLSITCNGVTRNTYKDFQPQVNVGAGSYHEMYSSEFIVDHDINGDKTISTSSNMTNAVFSPNTANASGNVTLSKINLDTTNIRVRVNGEWKQATLYLNKNGTYVKPTVYIKKSGTWTEVPN